MKAAFFLTSAVLLLSGCHDVFNPVPPEAVALTNAEDAGTYFSSALRARNKALVNGRPMELQQTVIVTSIVDVNDVRHTCAFGRMFSEQLAGVLADRGMSVTELKLADAIRISDQSNASGPKSWNQGEFVLSRAVQDLANNRGATAIIAGTYAVGDDTVLVSVRALDPQTGRIIASKNFTVPYSDRLFSSALGLN